MDNILFPKTTTVLVVCIHSMLRNAVNLAREHATRKQNRFRYILHILHRINALHAKRITSGGYGWSKPNDKIVISIEYTRYVFIIIYEHNGIATWRKIEWVLYAHASFAFEIYNHIICLYFSCTSSYKSASNAWHYLCRAPSTEHVDTSVWVLNARASFLVCVTHTYHRAGRYRTTHSNVQRRTEIRSTTQIYINKRCRRRQKRAVRSWWTCARWPMHTEWKRLSHFVASFS